MAVRGTSKNHVRRTRSATLALIAMLELLLLCVSLTFSWFERATDPVLIGYEIKTADALLSYIEMGPGSVPVDLSQYFERSDKAKFSPVHSDDGVNFTSPSGLKMNAGEIHAAVLTFQFKVISAGTNCNFWFNTLELNVNDVTAYTLEQREIQLGSNLSEEEAPIDEAVAAGSSAAVTEEPSTEEVSTENSVPQETESESPDVTEATTEEIEGEESTEATEAVSEESTENVEEKPDTKEPASLASAFYICFSDGTTDPKIMSFAEAQRYMNSAGDSLFSCTNQETVITCSVWLDYESDAFDDVPVGATVSINMVLSSDWAATRTIEFTDDTLQMDSVISQLGGAEIVVEAYHSATDTTYPATYDRERNVWCVDIPLAIDEFEMRYRLNGSSHDVIASWDILNAENVQRISLMDEGMYLVMDS